MLFEIILCFHYGVEGLSNLLPEINIDALLNIPPSKTEEPEISDAVEPPKAAAPVAVCEENNSNRNVENTDNPSVASVATVQQYRNTEIMQTNSKDNLQKQSSSSTEDYDTDDSSRVVDLHVRDMV